MRWREVDFTRESVHLFDATECVRVLSERGRPRWRVPKWAWDLYLATFRQGQPWWVWLEERLRAAKPHVGTPSGVDEDTFTAAVRLGGWDAAAQLLPRK
jgi:hypothetical protein